MSTVGFKKIISSMHLQSLVKKLVQVNQDRGVIHHQGCARAAGRFVRRVMRGSGKGDDGKMGRAGIGPQGGNACAHSLRERFQIGQDQERLFLFGMFHQLRRIGQRLNSVTEVLQAVYQLPGRQQPFIDEQREWSRHHFRLESIVENCKSFPVR